MLLLLVTEWASVNSGKQAHPNGAAPCTAPADMIQPTYK